jgi:hypothetical protein
MTSNMAFSKLLLLIIIIILLFCITCADRHARRSGVRPKALNSRTLCCVGLVFYKKGKKRITSDSQYQQLFVMIEDLKSAMCFFPHV